MSIKNGALEIGAWTRPWAPFGLETALTHIKASGFETVALMTANRPAEPERSRYVIEPDDGEAHVAEVERLVRASGLRPLIVLVRSRPEDVAQSLATLRRGIAIARRLGAPYVQGGASRPEVREALADFEAAGVQWLSKPHGGPTATAADCLALVREVDSPHFGILWDPGNVWHYTKTPPEEGFAPLAPHVRGMSLKDSPHPGQPSPVRPGLGRVDWRFHFTVLRDAGFAGPCLFETLPGTTPEEVDAAAVESRAYFQELIASVGM
jgi:sugar phosphate isomerase/epimerase